MWETYEKKVVVDALKVDDEYLVFDKIRSDIFEKDFSKVTVSADTVVVIRPKDKTAADGGRPGYDYDPYAGETQENFIVSKLVAWILLRTTGLVVDADGFCSTAREWHIMLAGVWEGLRAKIFADIPDCPPLWMDEMQYYRGGATVSNVGKIVVAAAIPTMVGVMTAGGDFNSYINIIKDILITQLGGQI